MKRVVAEFRPAFSEGEDVDGLSSVFVPVEIQEAARQGRKLFERETRESVPFMKLVGLQLINFRFWAIQTFKSLLIAAGLKYSITVSSALLTEEQYFADVFPEQDLARETILASAQGSPSFSPIAPPGRLRLLPEAIPVYIGGETNILGISPPSQTVVTQALVESYFQPPIPPSTPNADSNTPRSGP